MPFSKYVLFKLVFGSKSNLPILQMYWNSYSAISAKMCSSLITPCVLLFGVTLISQIQTKELSLLSSRDLRNSLSTNGLKRAFVDFETDIVSAISPLTISGIQYPWKILTADVARAQHDSLVLDRRRLNLNSEQTILSSDIDDMNFLLFNDRRNFNYSIRMDLTQSPSSQNINRIYNRGEQVKILIHGFQSGPRLSFAEDMKNAYLQETNHTVIVVDWEVLSLPKNKITRLLLYPAVTTNAFKVGEQVASLIEYLLENRVILDLSQVHIIGHSLGAHAAGHAGSLIYSEYGKKIGRITALDAAFLAFIGPSVKLRLDKGDAKFVDAIHTSGIGIYDPIAHVDFYPNGGRNQVSCYNPETYRANTGNSEFNRVFEAIIQSCSHARAYHYFVNTIKKENTFWACKCISWKDYRTFCRDSCSHRERFGEYVSPTARGKYFLDVDP